MEKIFLVTGGRYSKTTEILEEKKWKVLNTGDLPTQIYGFGLATLNNEVFAFGKYLFFLLNSLT